MPIYGWRRPNNENEKTSSGLLFSWESTLTPMWQ